MGGLGFGLLLLRLIVATWFFETGVPMIGVSPVASLFALVLVSPGWEPLRSLWWEPFALFFRSC
jgi:hypothetical protein